MFRTSLRSVLDPLCQHVCFSCRARGLERPAQTRLFHSTPLSRTDSGTQISESASTKGTDDAIKNSQETLESEPSEPSGKKRTDATPSEPDRGSRGYLASALKSRIRGKVRAKQFTLRAVEMKTEPVPRLSFGLDRVLFNPGVYHLRDRRTRVYNFDPYLGSIMPVSEFDFAALKDYITSSKDDTLHKLAVKHRKRYIGSSSSMTGVLSHFHYLLSAWRPLTTDMLSRTFPEDLTSFTRLSRAPTAMFLRYQNGVYAIDADKEFDSANILMNLGKSMEKLLTLPKEDFERYRRSHENKITPEEEALTPESYHYSTYGDFMMRSQLDAYDPRLPGTGMFDLKTRAVVSIRMDVRNFEKGLGYQIMQTLGKYESFEREYYDMIRSAFLKYSLQVRIGRMDGIFVAFHNIEKIFGFQYVSLGDMDYALHGQHNRLLGDTEFQLSLGLWNRILNEATTKYPNQSLRFHFETRETKIPSMYVFYEPVTDEQITAIQTKNQAEIDAYQQRVLNLLPNTDDQYTPSSSSPPAPINEDIMVEATEPAAEREISAMVVTIKNRQNGEIVERPTKFKKDHIWTVDYELGELSGPQVQKLYDGCVKRRMKILTAGREDSPDETLTSYIRKLRELSKLGRLEVKKDKVLDKKLGIVILDDEKKKP
ncbi:hypothetical protein BDV12DRAFT_162864 [Aspergillus spectabilis]